MSRLVGAPLTPLAFIFIAILGSLFFASANEGMLCLCIHIILLNIFLLHVLLSKRILPSLCEPEGVF